MSTIAKLLSRAKELYSDTSTHIECSENTSASNAIESLLTAINWSFTSSRCIYRQIHLRRLHVQSVRNFSRHEKSWRSISCITNHQSSDVNCATRSFTCWTILKHTTKAFTVGWRSFTANIAATRTLRIPTSIDTSWPRTWNRKFTAKPRAVNITFHERSDTKVIKF